MNLWITLGLIQIIGLVDLVSCARKCNISRESVLGQKLYIANCAESLLENIPDDLPTHIEVLDLHKSRIRSLEGLGRYTNLKYLYLDDNHFYPEAIDDNTFNYLDSLEVLDISYNQMIHFHPSILKLPHLRKLNISRNEFKSFNDDIKDVDLTLTTSLQEIYLNGSKLTEFPDFGIFPWLKSLDVSNNPIQSLNFSNVAGLCGLKTLHISSKDLNEEDKCNVYLDVYWEELMLSVVFNDFNEEDQKHCKTKTAIENEHEYLNGSRMSFEDRDTYKQCNGYLEKVEANKVAKTTWTVIASCIGVTLLIAIMILCILHRRNKKQTKNTLKFISDKKYNQVSTLEQIPV